MKSEAIKLTGTLKGAIDEVDHKLAAGAKKIVLDFQHVTFVSVEGLEWLEELLLRAQSSNCEISFVSIPTTIYKVFKVAHIEIIYAACGSLPISGPVC